MCLEILQARFGGGQLEKEPQGNLASWLPTFDKINHEALLNKLETAPKIRRQIKAWLKCGVMTDYANRRELQKTEAGTPQGGVISPLLANIALHGMENDLRQYMGYEGSKAYALTFVRYADDFVILHKELKEVQKAKTFIQKWLESIGLELKPSKTRIAHTLNQYGNENPGFNFLGSHVQQYPVGYHKRVKCGKGKEVEFEVVISPSKSNFKAHTDKIRSVLKKRSKAPQEAVIKELNLIIIQGWCNYHCSSPRIRHYLEKTEWITWQMLRGWARRRVGKDGDAKQYWNTIKHLEPLTGKWRIDRRFSTKSGVKLFKHTDTKYDRVR